MIDAWFFAAICLIFLAFCAVMRVIPSPTREDRFIALNTATTIAATAAIALSISWGNLFMLDVLIAVLALCYTGTITWARYRSGDGL